MTLRQMTPRATQQHLRHSSLRNTALPCQIGYLPIPTISSIFISGHADLRSGEFAVIVQFPTGPVRAVPTLRHHILHIIFLGSQKEVIGANTQFHVAVVANEQAIWNLPKVNLPRGTVHRYVSFAIAHATVARPDDRPCPQPTPVGLFHTFPKTLRQRACSTFVATGTAAISTRRRPCPTGDQAATDRTDNRWWGPLIGGCSQVSTLKAAEPLRARRELNAERTSAILADTLLAGDGRGNIRLHDDLHTGCRATPGGATHTARAFLRPHYTMPAPSKQLFCGRPA